MAASRCLIVLPLALAALLSQPPPAHADPEPLVDPREAAAEVAAEVAGEVVATGVHEILASLDGRETSWLSRHMDRMRISRYGLTYSYGLDHVSRGMRLRVGGPRMRGSGDLGLSIELRF